MTLPFKQVDVFTAESFKGNPVAVIFDADNLSTEQMQQISNWTNLSETVFVLTPSTPDADYKLRIFTPGSELDFAGHPTIGAAHAVIEARGITKTALVQECKAGLVELTVKHVGDTRRIFFKLARFNTHELNDTQISDIKKSLNYDKLLYDPITIDVGPKWVTCQFETVDDVLNCNPDYQYMAQFSTQNKVTGLNIFAKHPSGDIEIRSFAPSEGINEDPVCGSGNAAAAIYLNASGQILDKSAVTAYTATQGVKLNRNGIISVEVQGESYKVGGEAKTIINGTISV